MNEFVQLVPAMPSSYSSNKRQILRGEQFIAHYIRQFRQFYVYSSPAFIRGARLFSFFCGVVVIGIAFLVLSGWLYDISLFKSIFPGFPVMTAENAGIFLFAGFALVLSHIYIPHPVIRFFINVVRDTCIIIVLLSGACALFIYWAHPHSSSLSFFGEALQVGDKAFVRIEPNVAIFFLLIGFALLTLRSRLFDTRLSQYVVLLCSILLLPAVISYIYNVDFIYSLSSHTKIALPAVIAFLFLLIGIFIARPQQGLMAVIVSESAGGIMARRLLFSTIITPLLLGGILSSGYRLGWYSADYRFLLLIFSIVIVYTTSVWRNAKALHGIDTERRQSVEHMIFLAAAGKLFGFSLEYTMTLRSVTELAIGHIADWCSVDMLLPDGTTKLVALSHKNQQKIRSKRGLRKDYALDMLTNSWVSRVLRTGKPALYPLITEEFLATIAKNSRQLQALRSILLSSVMIVPLLSHNKTIGAITFVSTKLQRQYNQSDLSVAEELASRASLAIENSRLYKQAQDATRLRDEFISIASHELKTPVTSLKVYTQVIEQQLQRSGNMQEVGYIHKMDGQIDKLTKLIEDLLNISKMQVGKLAFERKEFSLAALVAEIVEAIQPTLKHHTIVQDIQEKPMILGDRDRIGQIIINLITNAIKYSPKADSVVVRLRAEGDNCTIRVEDFGIGIDEKHLSRIFDRFYQIHDAKGKTFPGLGIGLYISRAIARRHGGEIKVESTKGRGSIFSLMLPVDQKKEKHTTLARYPSSA